MADMVPNPEYGMSLEDCTQKCFNALPCNNYTYVEPNGTCYYINAVGTATLESVNETGTTYYTASFQCITPLIAPALPEDALELSYINVCRGSEYQEVTEAMNTWNITTCPSKLLHDQYS